MQMITSHEQAQSRMGVSSCFFPAFKFLSVEHGRLLFFSIGVRPTTGLVSLATMTIFG